MPRDDRQRLGELGEDLACRELRRRGYAILARRYRTRHGEIDIIARDGPTIVFVEVKARRGRAFGRAVEAVTRTKRRRLVLMAGDYLACRTRRDGPCRFDVVEVDVGESGTGVTVYPAAFLADGA